MEWWPFAYEIKCSFSIIEDHLEIYVNKQSSDLFTLNLYSTTAIMILHSFRTLQSVNNTYEAFASPK